MRSRSLWLAGQSLPASYTPLALFHLNFIYLLVLGNFTQGSFSVEHEGGLPPRKKLCLPQGAVGDHPSRRFPSEFLGYSEPPGRRILAAELRVEFSSHTVDAISLGSLSSRLEKSVFFTSLCWETGEPQGCRGQMRMYFYFIAT